MKAILFPSVWVGLILVLFSSIALSANLTGSVTYKGPKPKKEMIKTDADPACGGPIYKEDVVVNPNGTLANVFVFVRHGAKPDLAGGETLPPVVLDQKGCHYSPHVLGIRVNQVLQVHNSDPTLHNVHAACKVNMASNNGMPNQGSKIEKKYAKPEQMIAFKCDVHSWMSAYVGVMDHPYFAVTDSKGTFTIKDLPAGDYIIQAWHEKFGTIDQNVKVDASGKIKPIQFGYAL